ncbi:MAG: hypothetical protein PHU61_02680 [Candidatus Absconditabacteria bacterium]|nr:hypothetical protein [Candidatus Absconditabacteria bacterium]MDD3868123.1 hypothetical protein [Candidatus Absconditabacteria bacterium]MDD4714509.1 hypothetical protein [Candidatus Absconditabacteria bacterium]
MKVVQSLSKHLIILVLGITLGILFAFLVYDARDLSASILNLQERQFMTELKRDAAYKKSNNEIEVFISSPLQSEAILFASFLYAPQALTIDTSLITSPYSYEIISDVPGEIIFQITNFSQGDVDEGVLIIPFLGETKDITLEYITNQLETYPYAIGDLGELTEHL